MFGAVNCGLGLAVVNRVDLTVGGALGGIVFWLGEAA